MFSEQYAVDARRDQELDKSVWYYYNDTTGSRRCDVCGERFWDGYTIGEDSVCEDCKREQLRLAARYLNPIFADRLEELIENEAQRI